MADRPSCRSCPAFRRFRIRNAISTRGSRSRAPQAGSPRWHRPAPGGRCRWKKAWDRAATKPPENVPALGRPACAGCRAHSRAWFARSSHRWRHAGTDTALELFSAPRFRLATPRRARPSPPKNGVPSPVTQRQQTRIGPRVALRILVRLVHVQIQIGSLDRHGLQFQVAAWAELIVGLELVGIRVAARFLANARLGLDDVVLFLQLGRFLATARTRFWKLSARNCACSSVPPHFTMSCQSRR